MKSYLGDIVLQFKSKDVLLRLIVALIFCYTILFALEIFWEEVYHFLFNYLVLHRIDYHFGYIWRYFTYAFIHADVLHLVVNILMLYFFGTLFTLVFPPQKMFYIFLIGSVFAGVFYEMIAYFYQWEKYVVGASGGITAIFIALATYRPRMQVNMLLFGKVQLYWIALILVVYDLIQLPISSNSGGHLTHLGGALYGFFAGIYILKKVENNKITPLKKVKKHKNKTFEKIKKQDPVQQQIDQILDKISKSGYDSLSQEEKEFLFRQQ